MMPELSGQNQPLSIRESGKPATGNQWLTSNLSNRSADNRNENAAPAGDRNGAKFESADQRNQITRTAPVLARLIFRELKNEHGHAYGLEAVR
jgi:hypothetical protein